MKLLNRIQQDIEGAKVLKDWMGDGMAPVPREQAEARAAICELCPKNKKEKWWNLHQYLRDKIAEAIRYQIEMKKHLKMTLPNEDELGTCDVCGCNMPLKVWAPLHHILAHTPADAQWSECCWIPEEAKGKG